MSEFNETKFVEMLADAVMLEVIFSNDELVKQYKELFKKRVLEIVNGEKTLLTYSKDMATLADTKTNQA